MRSKELETFHFMCWHGAACREDSLPGDLHGVVADCVGRNDSTASTGGQLPVACCALTAAIVCRYPLHFLIRECQRGDLMHRFERNRDKFRAQLRWLEDGLHMLMRRAWSMITGWRDRRRDQSRGH